MAVKLNVSPPNKRRWGRAAATLRPRSRRAVIRYRSPRLHPLTAALLARGASKAQRRRRRPVVLIALAGAGAALLAAASKKLGGWGEQATVASNGAEFQSAMPDIAEGVEPDGTITTPAGDSAPAGNGAATGSTA